MTDTDYIKEIRREVAVAFLKLDEEGEEAGRVYARFHEDPNEDGMRMELNGEEWFVPGQVIEALYDIWNR